jgi:hypothetical protein
MNVSSLKNSKRLYELSGWVDVEAYYEYYPVADKHALRHSAPDNAFGKDRMLPDYIFPAYDAGYLLRKLPRRVDHEYSNHSVVYPTSKKWHAGYLTEGVDVKYLVAADTPEDALCLLAIKLFEEGIL